MVTVEKISVENIDTNMLMKFNHKQIIKEKYIKTENGWEVVNTDEVRQWNFEKRKWITEYMRQQIERGGVSLCAFDNEKLVGFCCVDGYICGETAKYANVTMLFVDDEFKRKGIGKKLFMKACDYAAKKGAEKIFISAIPSIETVAFYFSMGCVDAEEIIMDFVDTESDRYLEYLL